MEGLGDLFNNMFKSVMTLKFEVIADGMTYEWNLTEISQYCLLNQQDIENIIINKKKI